jgi:RimJ/RimL family protein N-acetyltransferase
MLRGRHRLHGVDWIEFDGGRWLEWGYRLVPAARGRGYATEASLALLEVASNDYAGEVLGIIRPDNRASQNVIRKLGFAYWKQAPVQGDLRNLYRLHVWPVAAEPAFGGARWST